MMLPRLLASFMLLCAALVAMSTQAQVATTTTTAKKLPVFFFHGITGNSSNGFNFKANLTAAGRSFFPLTFCETLCSLQAVPNQVNLAINQVRDIVAKNKTLFQDGYVFVGHSQGGAIARGVIENMDDHNVKKFISLAGLQNGLFYGPQPTDAYATAVFTNVLGPQILPPTVFNFSNYPPPTWQGKFQKDLAQTVLVKNVDLQRNLSVFNMQRPPVPQWAIVNPFTAVLNNLNVCSKPYDACEADKKRRKANFLRLQEAHFFASPAEDVLAPWQTSHFGHYNDVATFDEIETKFSSFKVLPMNQTKAYKDDTFGLRTLDKAGRLKLHVVPDVLHVCWIYDTTGGPANKLCKFKPVFDKFVYPVLK